MSDVEFAVCECGAVLPVRVEDLDYARRFRWFKVTSEFNKRFYRFLGQLEPPVLQPQAQDEIRRMREHKRCLGLTKAQCSAAVGLRHGVMGRNGRLAGSEGSACDLERATGDEDEGDAIASRTSKLTFTDREWLMVVDEALLASQEKPEQVDIQSELRWVWSKMREWPKFQDAPSQAAIKQWLVLNDPNGASQAEREFAKIYWTKRMSPGDPRGSKSAFDEDRHQVDTSAESDADTMRRLFGE